ncbi:hypothetical protein HPB48_002839 [Haemaphysalis longicornis]|uniref:Fucosyltransferase n=1 Tax=Haemaphysalis longicornis TaxID=44386 RepID=A0A9J6FDD8_HAELO|nr:hypothetical protein HPB48_002839 [Haemaphysalis longicornis]
MDESSQPNADELQTEAAPPVQNETSFRILMWTGPGRKRRVEGRPLPSTGVLPLRFCLFPERQATPGQPVVEVHLSNCYVTSDRSLFERSEAVVFDASDIHAVSPPTFRPPGQVWVFWTHRGSAPMANLGTMTTEDFNFTMGRRQDADVFIPFGNWTPVVGKAFPEPARNMHERKNNALLFVSDCDSKEGSEELMEVMEAVGGSTIRNCGVSDGGWLDISLTQSAKDYRFLFVADSSGCYEHPLEAIYDAFRFELVPVYFGSMDLGALPEHSVVRVRYLSPVAEVITQLKGLANDRILYNKYFHWKKTGSVVQIDDLCFLCGALHKGIQGRQVDALSWWNKTNVCPLSHRVAQSHSHPADAYILSEQV